MDGGVELNGADHGDGLAGREVALHGSQQMGGVDANLHENVERLDLGDVDGDQAAVRVVNQEVTFQRSRGVIVDTACAVGDVAHDDRLHARAKRRDDVGDGGREDKESLGKL